MPGRAITRFGFIWLYCCLLGFLVKIGHVVLARDQIFRWLASSPLLHLSLPLSFSFILAAIFATFDRHVWQELKKTIIDESLSTLVELIVKPAAAQTRDINTRPGWTSTIFRNTSSILRCVDNVAFWTVTSFATLSFHVICLSVVMSYQSVHLTVSGSCYYCTRKGDWISVQCKLHMK